MVHLHQWSPLVNSKGRLQALLANIRLGLKQGILKGEGEPVKQEVNGTVILPHLVFPG
jgi:hypothetical protein